MYAVVCIVRISMAWGHLIWPCLTIAHCPLQKGHKLAVLLGKNIAAARWYRRRGWLFFTWQLCLSGTDKGAAYCAHRGYTYVLPGVEWLCVESSYISPPTETPASGERTNDLRFFL